MAVNRLSQALKVGASRPWPDVLEVITGERKINANAIIEYFKPLEEWLDDIIKKDDIPLGWESKFQHFFQNP